MSKSTRLQMILATCRGLLCSMVCL